MTDATPSEFFWMDLYVRLSRSQSSALMALMTDIRRILETIATPDGEAVVLWLNSTYQEGSTTLQKIPDSLVRLRSFINDHNGDPTGFTYGVVAPPDPEWWLKFVPKNVGPGLPLKPTVEGLKAYSKAVFEKRCVWFASQTDVTPHFRQFSYAMDVFEFALSPNDHPLRMKVYDKPTEPVEGHTQMWVLCHMTQENL